MNQLPLCQLPEIDLIIRVIVRLAEQWFLFIYLRREIEIKDSEEWLNVTIEEEIRSDLITLFTLTLILSLNLLLQSNNA